MTIFNTNKIIENGGITLRLFGLDLVNSKEVGGNYWYFPLLPDRTIIVDEDKLPEGLDRFVAINSDVLFKRGRYLGVWHNPGDSKYYLDINIRRRDKIDALQKVATINKSSTRKILAIYNPIKDTVVEVRR